MIAANKILLDRVGIMDEATYGVILVINFATIGLIFTALWKWKKTGITVVNHVLPTLISVILDVVCLAGGLIYVPICLPSLAVVFLGINFRSQDWPSTPKFATYYKYYIILLTCCLVPGLVILSRIQGGIAMFPLDHILMMIFLFITMFVFSFSNPIKSSQWRESGKLNGVGLGFLGLILPIFYTLLFDPFSIVGDGFVTFLSLISLVAAILLSLPFFLPVTKQVD